MKSFTFVLACLLTSFVATAPAEEPADKAKQMATDIWKSSGGEEWPNIVEIDFTFVVEQQDGKTLASVAHKWNLAKNTDEVKWKTKDGTDKDITVNLAAPSQDEDGKMAFARWTNDSYWLLAPLKLRDAGVTLSYEGSKGADGMAGETIRAKFDKVGLTPGDQYVYYIDAKTNTVFAWDYIPKADTVMHATWDKYEYFSGLKLSTEHKMGDKMIRFKDITVAMDK